jgi:holo-[acyl-carrier protein] synthase
MIGVDIVEIERIRRMREKFGERFLTKVFTDREIEYALRRRRPDESLAARFAAKEAFMKAWDTRANWTDIEVCLEESGRPYIIYGGRRFQEISISHEKTHAVCVVSIGDNERRLLGAINGVRW